MDPVDTIKALTDVYETPNAHGTPNARDTPEVHEAPIVHETTFGTPEAPSASWRSKVAIPGRFTGATAEFLDMHHAKGKLSRVGTFHLKDEIGALVPYDLLPLKVKKLVNLMPINRQQFTGSTPYKTALVVLFTYGYMRDVDRGLVERARYWHAYRARWQLSNPQSTQATRTKRTDQQLIYGKIKEDRLLQLELDYQ